MVYNNNCLADIFSVWAIKDLIWVMRFQSPLIWVPEICMSATLDWFHSAIFEQFNLGIHSENV